jgi:hypothetical protein
MKLPGSRTDIIRTQKISGPSPVGGSAGGTEGRVVQTLDEFELQAAHYNIACAYARLGKVTEVSFVLITYLYSIIYFCFRRRILYLTHINCNQTKTNKN